MTITAKASRSTRANRIPLTEAQKKLAGDYLALARKLAKPLKSMLPHLSDEFESAACLALVEAARSFDPSRNVRFATFARFRIRGALKGVGRSVAPKGLAGLGDAAPKFQSLNSSHFDQGRPLLASVPPEVGSEFADLEAVERRLRKLPPNHAHVCRRYYMHGENFTEIAADLGLSESEISRRHKLAIDLLRPVDGDGNPITPANPINRRARRSRPAPIPA